MLEGIGLIEKRNKNCIVWKGAIEGEDTKVVCISVSKGSYQLGKIDRKANLAYTILLIALIYI